MKTTLENILELFERADVYLVSDDERYWLRLVHGNHQCYINKQGEPEKEMNMSDDTVIKIMLNGELATREEYLSCKMNGNAGENIA